MRTIILALVITIIGGSLIVSAFNLPDWACFALGFVGFFVVYWMLGRYHSKR